MSAPRSLRRDLAFGLVLGLGLMWLAAILGAALVLREELDEVFDSALRETAERLLPLAVTEIINTGPDTPARRVSPVRPHEEYLTYVVRGRDGAIVLQSQDARAETFATAPRPGYRTTADHRIYTSSTVSGDYLIEVAEPLENRREATLETTGALVLPVLVLLPLSLLGVLWFTACRLRPVAALSAEVAGRDASDLAPLTTAGLQTELMPIRDAVNRLMAHLARTLEAERNFTANAAHELRTPVAASLAQTQRLIAEAPDGPLRDRARAIEAELQRLARLGAKLLDLSRAEGGAVLAPAPRDLAPILDLVVADFTRAGAPRLRLSRPAAAPSRLDPDAFAILARNLIENALTHGDPAQPVAVTLGADASLRVVNAGPVVPPDQLDRLTRRFERAGSRARGAGLGLAIAASIAEAAGARLVLSSPAPGRNDGFEAALIPA